MDEGKIIEVKRNILADNDKAADDFRAARAAEGTYMVDIMASPGAGKTTLLLALIEHLRKDLTVGVIEADLESDVDALKIKAADVDSVELNTRGVCHVEMGMVEKAFAAFGGKHYDCMFLENIGNLVCPADFDTGCHTRVMLLSPDFDMEALKEGARALNPGLPIFVTSARTGEGIEELAEWFKAKRAEALA